MSSLTLDRGLEPHSRTTDIALIVVRLALSLPLIYHGAAIAFGAFGGPGLHGFSGFTHMPLPVAGLVGYGEFLGGLGILFGVLARPAAAGIALIMLGAVLIVHLKNGYDVAKGGLEYALVLALLSLAVVIAGPGRYNALALIKRKDFTRP